MRRRVHLFVELRRRHAGVGSNHHPPVPNDQQLQRDPHGHRREGCDGVYHQGRTRRAGTPPTAAFTTSPANPGVNQDVFFNATGSVPAAGRTITSYDWSFGDGSTGTGRRDFAQDTPRQAIYQVQLTTPTMPARRATAANLAHGRAGRVGHAGRGSTGDDPTPKANQPTSFNASASKPGTGSNITGYVFNWGDGSPEETTTTQSRRTPTLAAGSTLSP